MKLKYILTTCLFFILYSVTAQDYMKVKAKNGDTVYGLLRAYQLDEYPCNLTAFFKINNLKENAQLKKDKTYLLPIKVYKFNNKSIRTSIGISDYKQALQIQYYNDRLFGDKTKSGDFRRDKELWVPNHEIKKCDKKTVELSIENRTFPIFGKKYEHVPLESKTLEGRVYYIVSGHGGPDPGAVSRQNNIKVCEDEYAYDISLRLARNLISHGATVHIIVRDPNDGIRSGTYLKPDKDETCWKDQKMPINQKERLNQRHEAINDLYEEYKKKGVKHQTAVMIHIDSRSVNKRIDLFFYYFPGSNAGKQLALTVRSVIKAQYAKYQKNRGYGGTVKSRDLHMLRETKPTALYIELGNLKNVSDQQRFLKEGNRQALADWLAQGLIKAK